MPTDWWSGRPPAGEFACYKTKTDALNVFLHYNWRIVEESFRGPDYSHGYEGFDNINHRYGLKGKRRVDTLAKAVWWSLAGPKPWCLANIDVDQLNDTDIAQRAEAGFALPEWAEEQQLMEEQEQWWRDQGTEPKRWKCAYPDEEVPYEEEIPF